MNGAIVWFTGLPSSGKSHLASRVRAELVSRNSSCCMLDGDRIRSLLHPRPGYSGSERDAFYLTLGELALELAEQGLIVLVPATANRRVYRDRIRTRSARFFEVWLTATTEECRARDSKGLYAASSQQQLSGLPGADLAYEPPEFPDVQARGGEDERALADIIRLLSVASSATAE